MVFPAPRATRTRVAAAGKPLRSSSVPASQRRPSDPGCVGQGLRVLFGAKLRLAARSAPARGTRRRGKALGANDADRVGTDVLRSLAAFLDLDHGPPSGRHEEFVARPGGGADPGRSPAALLRSRGLAESGRGAGRTGAANEAAIRAARPVPAGVPGRFPGSPGGCSAELCALDKRRRLVHVGSLTSGAGAPLDRGREQKGQESEIHRRCEYLVWLRSAY